MLKQLSFILILLQSISAKEFNIETGLLSYLSTTPYKGMPYDYFLVPLISAEYKGLYISGTESGYIIFSDQILLLSFELSPTLIGYQSDDSKYFKGMKDRDITVESGIKLEYTYNSHKLKIKLVYDFFDVYNGYSSLAEYSYTSVINNKNIFLINTGIEYFSAQKSTYYFGVLESESSLNRKSYSLDRSKNLYASIDYIYFLNENWNFFANIEYKYYDHKIYKSPIVDKKSAISNFIGAVYAW